MTSSVDNPSDNGDTSEQHSHPEPQLQSTCQVTGISHPVMAPPNMQYVMPPTLGAGNAMATAAFPYPDPYCRSVFTPYDSHSYPPQPYPAQPMVHLQLMGIQQPGVPLPSDAIEEPVFVNAKQYHGILRRRQSRAKAESEAKAAKSRKPYLHESRHLHALRRARGTGGRFLNAKKGSNQPNERKSSDKPESNINLNGEKDDQASSESAS